MATGPVNNNPYLQQVLFQNLSSTNVQPNQLKTSAQLISSAFAAKSGIATISANGAKLNNVSQTIRASGDMQAYEGFQTAVRSASAASDPLQLVRFSNSADFVARTDSQMLSDTFSSLARISGGNNDALTQSFNATFTSTVEKAGIEGLALFNRGVEAVEKADYSGSGVTQAENLQKFFTLTRSINSTGESEAEITGNLERLVKGAELAGSADEIWRYFSDFVGPDPDNIG
ncbi:MAG: hypothetical protein PWR01_2812 [Clostridiales bacterium]|jgi:hypothetical protein|nr:hypothetical protein [Clostridiales bacterium]MDN5281739.1 hypothetical protein [Candidatus Ozemobacter sp.]